SASASKARSTFTSTGTEVSPVTSPAPLTAASVRAHGDPDRDWWMTASWRATNPMVGVWPEPAANRSESPTPRAQLREQSHGLAVRRTIDNPWPRWTVSDSDSDSAGSGRRRRREGHGVAVEAGRSEVEPVSHDGQEPVLEAGSFGSPIDDAVVPDHRH